MCRNGGRKSQLLKLFIWASVLAEFKIQITEALSPAAPLSFCYQLLIGILRLNKINQPTSELHPIC